MPDFADIASKETERLFHQAMARQVNRWAGQARESALHCFDCGCEIPLARREAVPGCEYCVSCQEVRE